MAAEPLRLGAAALLSYVIGSIPTAYLIVRWLKRIDVRTVGSGNVGATNATRAAGAKVGALVFLCDAAKGLAAVLIAAPWVIGAPAASERWLCGVAAVAGHMFPFALGFRGGKGVATAIGVVLGTSPAVAGIMLLCWVAGFTVWRYVSLASMIAAASIPLTQAALQQPAGVVGWSGLLALLVIGKHYANIARLLDGTEHRWTRERR